MIRLHQIALSENCHKARLPLSVPSLPPGRIAAATPRVIGDALAHSRGLVGDEAGIADLAGYPSLALSPAGGVDLLPRANLLHRFGNTRRLDGDVGMPWIWE